MTAMINDGRACTQSVNDMMKAMEQKRHCPAIKGEVEHYKYAHFFGHYDSRGGGSVLLGIESDIKARIAYNLTCGWEPTSNAAAEDHLASIELVVVGKPIAQDEGGELLYKYNEEEGYFLFRAEKRYVGTDGKVYDFEETDFAVLVHVTDEFLNTERAAEKLAEKIRAQIDKKFGPDSWLNPEAQPERKKLDDTTETLRKRNIESLTPDPFVQDLGYGKYEYRFKLWEIGEDACGCICYPPRVALEIDQAIEINIKAQQ